MWSHLTHRHPSLNLGKTGQKSSSLAPGNTVAKQSSLSGFKQRATQLYFTTGIFHPKIELDVCLRSKTFGYGARAWV